MYKILALDDDKFILVSLMRSLRKQKDWQVEAFNDPAEALEQAQHQHYDLFLSDYQMPKIDGLEFLTKTRALQPDAMRIILSGDDSMEMVQQAVDAAGVYSFVNKPVENRELIAVLNEAFRHYQKAAVGITPQTLNEV